VRDNRLQTTNVTTRHWLLSTADRSPAGSACEFMSMQKKIEFYSYFFLKTPKIKKKIKTCIQWRQKQFESGRYKISDVPPPFCGPPIGGTSTTEKWGHTKVVRSERHAGFQVSVRDVQYKGLLIFLTMQASNISRVRTESVLF